MSKTVKIKHDDQVVFEDMSHLSFETEETNIQVEHSEVKGFCVSVYDRKKKTMCYYDVVDGQLKLSSKEDTSSGEEMLLRDDIKDKVFDLITTNFTDPKFVVQEHHTWIELNMDAVDVVELSTFVEFEFDIGFISPDGIQKWTTVKDIVNYIETALEDKDGN